MTIEMIKMHNGQLTAICDNGEGVTLDMIDGGVRCGASIEQKGDRWAVTVNNADENCLNGVCSLPMPQGK